MSQDGRPPDPATRTEGETLDLPEGLGGFVPGQLLGERYQIRVADRGGLGAPARRKEEAERRDEHRCGSNPTVSRK